MRSAWIRGASVVAGLALAAGCIPENEQRTPKFLAAPDAGPAPSTAYSDAELANDPKSLLAKVDALKDELADRPRDFHINVALGTLFYENGRYIEAIQYYRDALAGAATAEQRLLALRNEAKVPTHAEVPESCRPDLLDARATAAGQKQRALETIIEEAQKREATEPAAAVACWAQTLPSIALVHAKRGNSWYLIGNPDKARADHAAALALDPDHPEALFFSGALTLELAKGDAAQLAEGKRSWERLLAVAPEHPRAALVRDTLPKVDQIFGPRPDPNAAHAAPHPAVAGGSGTMAPAMAEPSGVAPLDPATVKAVQGTEITPEFAATLDQLLALGEQHVAAGKWQDALDTLRGVMPYRPDGRVALAMGIALRELGKPTAERVLTQAQRMPGGDPARAKLELAKLYERTNPAQARVLLGELAADAKLGAEAKARLAKLP